MILSALEKHMDDFFMGLHENTPCSYCSKNVEISYMVRLCDSCYEKLEAEMRVDKIGRTQENV